MVVCTSTRTDPIGPAAMMRELRAAMAEFGPGGNYRTPDIQLASQMAVLDTMFHLSVRNAVQAKQVVSVPGTRENDFRTEYVDGDLYLDQSQAMLALKFQSQFRRIVEGLKIGEDRHKRTRLARMRLKMMKK